MMENSTVTPFLVKRNVKGEEGAGGTLPTMALLPVGNPDQIAEVGFELTGPCQPLLQGLWKSQPSRTQRPGANLAGSSSTAILSWKLVEDDHRPFPS